MDLISAIGADNDTQKADASVVEYTGQVISSTLSGDVSLRILSESLLIATALDTTEIAFVDITSIESVDYQVVVATQGKTFRFARLGHWCQPFYDELLIAYNRQVLRALFTQGDPLVKAAGDYRYEEEGVGAAGKAPLAVFENCICVLPPDIGARRIPLSFVTDTDKGDFTLSLTIEDDWYQFAKLGYETQPIEEAIETSMKTLREQNLSTIRSIDSSLTGAVASQLARMMPAGSAIPLGRLREIAPSFLRAAEETISLSRAAHYYEELKTLSDPDSIALGFIKDDSFSSWREVGDTAGGEGAYEGVDALIAAHGDASALEDEVVEAMDVRTSESSTQALPYLFYLVVPSMDRRMCAVEFAVYEGDSAATFVYRCEEGFDAFVTRLNRAMEAVDHARDVISMDEDKLALVQNRRYAMAVQRSSALRKVRAAFVGRVIHTTPESWKKNLLSFFK